MQMNSKNANSIAEIGVNPPNHRLQLASRPWLQPLERETRMIMLRTGYKTPSFCLLALRRQNELFSALLGANG